LSEIEFRRARPEDFPGILRIQSANQIANLSSEEREQGFLSAQFSLEQIAAMAGDLGIIVAAESGTVLGFLCGFRCDFNTGSPVIAGMLETFAGVRFDGKPLSASKTFIYGPVCIDRPFRGRGLLHGLYEAQKRELAGQFDVGVAFVSRSNPHSLKAHVAGLGMTEVGEFEVKGNVYVTLAFKVPDCS
jgi:predicted GNAT superfamily acetyltransferase